MNKILDLLTSIKFWTIVGAIASGIGLWYALSDKSETVSLGLSTGSYGTAALPDDKTFVLVNYICAPGPEPVIFPIEIDMANMGKKGLSNVSMRWYFTDNNDGFNVPLINDLVSSEKRLSVFYRLENGAFLPHENGNGFHCPQNISPKTVAGSLEKVYCPTFADTTVQRHKFDIEIKADETQTEIFHVLMYTTAIFPDKNGNFDRSLIDDADKRMSKIVRDETSAGIVNIIAGLWEQPLNTITIDGIPFVKFKMELGSVRSIKSK